MPPSATTRIIRAESTQSERGRLVAPPGHLPAGRQIGGTHPGEAATAPAGSTGRYAQLLRSPPRLEVALKRPQGRGSRFADAQRPCGRGLAAWAKASVLGPGCLAALPLEPFGIVAASKRPDMSTYYSLRRVLGGTLHVVAPDEEAGSVSPSPQPSPVTAAERCTWRFPGGTIGVSPPPSWDRAILPAQQFAGPARA